MNNLGESVIPCLCLHCRYLPDVSLSGDCYILDSTLIGFLLALTLTVDLSVQYLRKKTSMLFFGQRNVLNLWNHHKLLTRGAWRQKVNVRSTRNLINVESNTQLTTDTGTSYITGNVNKGMGWRSLRVCEVLIIPLEQLVNMAQFFHGIYCWSLHA